MATPAPAASDVANSQADDPPQAEAAAVAEPEGTEAEAASAAESGGASSTSAVEAAAVADGAPPGDAVPSAPDPTSTSSSAAPPPPASPATLGPPRLQFAGSPAYMAPPAPAPPPAFSYNVLPRAPTPSQVGSGAAPHQPSSSPDTNHAGQVSRFVPPGSLQPPAPGQLARPSAAFPGIMAQNSPGSIQLPFPVPRPSNIPFGASPQQGNSDVNTSKSDAPSAPEVSPGIMQMPTGLQSNSPSTIASASGSPSVPIQIPTNPSVPPRPEVFGAAGSSIPGQPSAIFSNPPSLLGRPFVPSAAPLPQTTPSFATPDVIPQNSQPPFYPSYPSAHGMVPPQPLWGHHHPQQPTGFQQAPFQSYPAGPVGSHGRPMVGTSAVTAALPNVQPPGVSTGGGWKEQASTNPGSEQPARTSAEPPSTGHGGQVNDQLEEKRNTGVQDSDAWSAHKTEAGLVYYYNALTGESTYQRPPCYKGEPEKVAIQPVPVSWDKLAGTDWSIVTTSDGKKYYYDNKQKVSSWQLPREVAELLKDVESGSLKEGSNSLQDAGTIENTGVISIDTSTPAIQTGGRDSLPLRQTVAPASPSALDLIKKKLQDAGASSAPSPLATPSSAASDLNGSKPADAAPKGHQVSNNGDKSKDNNCDVNMSDSSSDSDDEEHGSSKEDCICQFKVMLKERGVAPFSKWEKELPKIVFDPRFKAIPSHSTRRAIFDHYVRTRAEEVRKEKRAAQKAAVEAYKQLLEEASEDINTKTDYQEFKRKWGADPRFEALDRKERDALFNEKVKAVQEKIQSTRKAVIADFKSMLRESKDITSTSRWTKVKENFRSDSRYKAMKHEERETIFNEYIAELKSAEREAEQAAKAKVDEQAKLRERERETRKRKEREEQEMEREKLKIQRKEAVSSYQALLVEMIKDPKASWTESKPKLEKDPQGRAVNPDLGQGDAEKLFRDHVKDLYERCVRDFRALLSEIITPEVAARTADEGKTAINSWSEAKDLLRPDPRYNKLASKDRESIWRRYVDDLMRKLKHSDTKEKEKSDTDVRQRRSSDLPRRR
ncbi:pre-mRNA-processing protein 40C-like isoform X2 [Phragmites australis]|uniref:pre-mRNA-processing protein 40C-like isoform X2 n=1 Tax=Phragmites australis TaxID=29695 RepID=UPI002D78B42C|nr:pre-mRNA-processing protein 40C-like isoform X2 [Phragmites australis]